MHVVYYHTENIIADWE